MRTYAVFATFFMASLVGVSAVGQPIMAPLAGKDEVGAPDRVENWQGKTILVFAPHPDDDTFSMGGTLARLVTNGNKVVVVIYTNDNRGSKDLEMSRERLAQIRRAEEEAACLILGISKESIVWLGYEDGDLEYADPQRLRGEVCRLIKIHRPDAVFCPDPGSKWQQWHKTDHRMSANITKDAFIAAEWHLYYPQHLLDEGLKPYAVPVAYYYYSQEPNYEVDITDFINKKVKASAAHVSQFEPATTKYTPDMADTVFQEIDKGLKAYHAAENRFVERFRREEAP
ncbi:MAG TPA: PIG-L family deacetylase [Candidatus Hydrogenedentes bacterium]|nr:PIG-L family deacetylase [Candidatus Hydrogenedentota bacterium]HQH50971.1 PIG-L family deacetylase [Candidatus Hydrogenedentota bacterium]